MAWWQQVGTTIAGEFSDVPDLAEFVRVCLRLSVAALLGAALGYERGRREAAAGLRTHMLVALGAALFVLAPLKAGMEPAELSRVMQGLAPESASLARAPSSSARTTNRSGA